MIKVGYREVNESYNPWKDMKKLPDDTEMKSGLYTDGEGGVYAVNKSAKSKLIKHKGYNFQYDYGKSEITMIDPKTSKELYTLGLSVGNWLDNPEYWMNDMIKEINESSDEYDPFKGKKYYVSGSTSNYPGEISKSSGPLYTDDPKKAIEEWFKINKKFPMETNIMSKTKKDAVALVTYASKNSGWIEELCSKYKCHYKVDYMIDAINKKVDDGCKGFYEGSYGFGDQVYPFCVG